MPFDVRHIFPNIANTEIFIAFIGVVDCIYCTNIAIDALKKKILRTIVTPIYKS